VYHNFRAFASLSQITAFVTMPGEEGNNQER